MTDNNQLPTLPSGYTYIKKLGEGGYGCVYLCRSESKGKEYAIKCFETNGDNGIPSLIEANIMSAISHPHLTTLEKAIVENQTFYLVQERAKCDLSTLVRKKNQPPPPNLLKFWCYALVEAVACLHQQNIIHADIKASNVLLFEGQTDVNGVPVIKLADFNLAHKLKSNTDQFSNKVCTNTHRPFEVWLGEKWDASIDIWSLGCTFFEMAYGVHLIPSQNWERDGITKRDLRDRFIACIEEFAKKGPGGVQKIPWNYHRQTTNYISFQIPPEFHRSEYSSFNQLILSMLRIDPKERPKISALLEHSYFQGLKPVSYDINCIKEEILNPQKEANYLEHLKRLSSSNGLEQLTMSIVKKTQQLKFRYPNFEDDKLRLVGAYWIAHKIITRRPPKLQYPTTILHRVEKKICEYLSYCLI